MKKMMSVLVLVALSWLAVRAQEATEKPEERSECTVITANVDQLRPMCADDIKTCLTATSMGFSTISAIQRIICPPSRGQRENIYDVLVSCTSQEEADLVFSGLCGNTTSPEKGVLLCTEAMLKINDGSAAKSACCSAGSGSGGSGSQCASELRQLSSDLGCCTPTIVVQYFFENCAAGGIDVLLRNNGVERPQLCDYPVYVGIDIIALTQSYNIYDVGNSSAARSASMATFILLAMCHIFSM